MGESLYEGDPRSNANPSVISFTFGIIKNPLPVYYDIYSSKYLKDQCSQL